MRVYSRRPLAERFAEKMNRNGPVHPTLGTACWMWTGSTNTAGYGQISPGGHSGRPLLAHRVAWELANGPVPAGLCVLHHCDNPSCVNPAHLFLGTKADNHDDCIAKGRDDRESRRRGEEHVFARLTAAQVAQLRKRAATGESWVTIAAALGVSVNCVINAGVGHTWKHLPGPVSRRGHARGEGTNSTPLTPDEVRLLRQRRYRGCTCAALGRAFGVSPATAWRIATGRSWKHVT